MFFLIIPISEQDILLSALQRIDYSAKSDYAFRIVEAIFQHNSLNEKVLKVKCLLLYQAGKQCIVHHVYDNFAKLYKEKLNAVFPIPFQDICSF